MENFYLFVVVLLLLLAVTDLVVGVSNDAVNFLNSAIGSRVASLKTILIIASIGVLLGSISSAGMMEVARSGIYYPQYFFFNEVMFICLAVMFTDVFLIDVYNTFALPTSTTVSLVSSLLGAAFVMTVIKLIEGNLPLNYLFNINDPDRGVIGYMNWSEAGKIVSAIFLSVLIAFILGSLVQYITRLIFTYQYKKRIKFFGGIWAGFALTLLFYFLFFKGLKETTDTVKDFLQYDYMKENRWQLMGGGFIFFTVLMEILIFAKVNVFRIVVLIGTFALAMAFAANDLVNFIGVPIAGLQAFQLWRGSGVAPDEFSMKVLAEEVNTPYGLILIAGFVMVLTLWLSSKSKSVIETEINLGRQNEGSERFQPNILSRIIVRIVRRMGELLGGMVPIDLKKWTSTNFDMSEEENAKDGQAFDLIRASVNLVVSSTLIAFATDLKLPLSTTYVTFMVAMGTSFADKAWGRESAVYRVAGVLNVIGGWLMTALIAFSVAGIFLLILYGLKIWGIIILILLILSALFFSHKYHKIIFSKKQIDTGLEIGVDMPEAILQTAQSNAVAIKRLKNIYNLALTGLFTESRSKLQKADHLLQNIEKEAAQMNELIYKRIKKDSSIPTENLQLKILNNDLLVELVKNTRQLVTPLLEHVNNSHKPMSDMQIGQLTPLQDAVNLYFDELSAILTNTQLDKLESILQDKKKILELNESLVEKQTEAMRTGEYGYKNNKTFFTITLESKDIVAVLARFVKLLSKKAQEQHH